MTFVPDGFEAPHRLATPEFTLEPLGPQHNEADYAAWTSSIEHIQASPGWAAESTWPHPMTLEENRGDLERHAEDFALRRGFTYTVLAPEDGDVIGCVYIYPAEGEHDASVRSWVRADRADLDAPLRDTVRAWLRDAWPFTNVAY